MEKLLTKKIILKCQNLFMLQGDLDLFRTVSTDKAYKEFEVETDLFNSANKDELMTENIKVRADTIIDNVAWISLNDGRDLNTTIRLIKTDSGWKTDVYNPFKEKSPLKNEVVKFPDLNKPK
ncbi:hypothetical protein CSC80_10600 [Maribacter sp. 6B07]|uniref:hypothetical protein n=1 Tax=Maribacter sp. 6B07 TaxID=2045442 RepID=UPI000C07FC91|nr:hypothetical protein [Maribacter sp. 6B07]PHN93370.1 hypothetical protein CSC80_10600 [Maribacter sp. 6B07]